MTVNVTTGENKYCHHVLIKEMPISRHDPLDFSPAIVILIVNLTITLPCQKMDRETTE
jgi:hypothetical protein